MTFSQLLAYGSFFMVFFGMAYQGLKLDIAVPLCLSIYFCLGAAGWVVGYGLRVAKALFFN